jgi:hypothetical protein
MSTILPPSDKLRRAVEWIATEKADRPKVALPMLVSEAALRFDLSPSEEEWLLFSLRKPAKT